MLCTGRGQASVTLSEWIYHSNVSEWRAKNARASARLASISSRFAATSLSRARSPISARICALRLTLTRSCKSHAASRLTLTRTCKFHAASRLTLTRTCTHPNQTVVLCRMHCTEHPMTCQPCKFWALGSHTPQQDSSTSHLGGITPTSSHKGCPNIVSYVLGTASNAYALLDDHAQEGQGAAGMQSLKCRRARTKTMMVTKQ